MKVANPLLQTMAAITTTPNAQDFATPTGPIVTTGISTVVLDDGTIVEIRRSPFHRWTGMGGMYVATYTHPHPLVVPTPTAPPKPTKAGEVWAFVFWWAVSPILLFANIVLGMSSLFIEVPFYMTGSDDFIRGDLLCALVHALTMGMSFIPLAVVNFVRIIVLNLEPLSSGEMFEHGTAWAIPAIVCIMSSLWNVHTIAAFEAIFPRNTVLALSMGPYPGRSWYVRAYTLLSIIYIRHKAPATRLLTRRASERLHTLLAPWAKIAFALFVVIPVIQNSGHEVPYAYTWPVFAYYFVLHYWPKEAEKEK